MREATEALLSALTVASPATVGLLAQEVCKLHIFAASQPTLQATPTSKQQEKQQWSQHPLCAAVLLSPAVAGPLINCSIAALGVSGTKDQIPLQAAWHQLLPFFSFLMLQGSHTSGALQGGSASAPQWSLFAPTLHAKLVRLACSQTQLSTQILSLLINSLKCMPVASEADQLSAASRLQDVLDVLELCLHASNQADAAECARSAGQVLLMLAWEALNPSAGSSAGNSGGAGVWSGPVLDALLRLQALCPDALAPHAPHIALLALGSVGKEKDSAFALLHGAIAAAGGDDAATAKEGPLLLHPLLGTAAYGTSAQSKGWAAGLVQLVQELDKPSQITATKASSESDIELWQGEPCLLQRARVLSEQLWSLQEVCMDVAGHVVTERTDALQAALRWLASLAASCQVLRGQRAATKAAAGSTPFSFTPEHVAAAAAAAAAQPGPAAMMLVGALLALPDPTVQAAAAAAVKELVLLLPNASLALLPLLLYCIQRSCKSKVAASNARAAAAAQVAMLGVLPAMTADAAIAPYALRALQPLTQAGAPLLLQCLGLRLLVESWMVTGETLIHGTCVDTTPS